MRGIFGDLGDRIDIASLNGVCWGPESAPTNTIKTQNYSHQELFGTMEIG